MKTLNLITQRRSITSIQLRVQTVGRGERLVTVEHFPFLIGRQVDADLRLKDHFVSHVHCLLDYVNGRLVVQDLESRNRTRLNGQPIRIAILHPRDTVDVGTTRLVVESLGFGTPR